MASIGVIQTTVSSEVATTSESFVEVAESADIVDGKTYHVICHALVESSVSAASEKAGEWRIVDNTNSRAVLSGSTRVKVMGNADRCESYAYLGRFTAGSGGGGIAFEQKAPSSTTVRTQYLSMVLLELSNMETSDYFFETDTTSATHTTTLADRVKKTIDSPSANDDWLVLGFCETSINNEYVNVDVLLNNDDTPIGTLEPKWSYEGEHSSEVLQYWASRKYAFTGTGDVEIIIQSRDDGSDASQNNYESSSLFGLRLNAFENSVSSFTSGETSTTATTWQELESLSLTTDSTGDVVVIGSSIFVGGSTRRKSNERIQVDGTTTPNSVPDSKFSANTNDPSGLLPLPYVSIYAATEDGSSVIALDVKKPHGADTGWREYTLAAFSVALLATAPINYSSVAIQTFTSGDVASQSYNSGDVASETFNSGDVASEVNPE